MTNKNSIPKDILSEALLKYQIERIEKEYPSVEECNELFTPNKETDDKINKLIKFEKKPYYSLVNTIGKRVACIILVLFISLTTTVFSVKALREPFVNFIVETYEKFSTIIFNKPADTNAEPQDAMAFEYYEPTYVPEGYTKSLEDKTILTYFCKYINENGSIFSIEQSKSDNSSLNIDTENTITEKVYINNYEGVYYENKGLENIIFNIDEYTFFVSGNIKKDELIAIAESIQKK